MNAPAENPRLYIPNMTMLKSANIIYGLGSGTCRQVLSLFLFWGIGCVAQAQTDSIKWEYSIREAIIQDSKIDAAGYHVWKSDSLSTSSTLSLSNRLFWENSLDVRQNAPGTLSTISARGAGPSRTAVLWNGLNLQSPMNGVMDVSLIPLWQSDKLEVQYGGNSAALGSGAMGGVVKINSNPSNGPDGISGSAGLEAGSFGRAGLQGSIGLGKKSYAGLIRASWEQAENDFPYQKTDLSGQTQRVHQSNNFGKKLDVQQFNQYSIDKKNTINSSAWIQSAFRQIPPSATEAPSDTWQRDRSARLLTSWQFQPNTFSSLQSNIAWLNEYIAFHFAGETEQSHAKTAMISSEWNSQTKNGYNLKIGSQIQQVWAKADGYKLPDNWYDQGRIKVYAGAKKRYWQRVLVSVSVRQEWVENLNSPFTGTLGTEWSTSSNTMLIGHFSRNFNLPTFNDRFWETLNSSNLQPEKGYSADLGFTFKSKIVEAELTAFWLSLDDWIIWLPGSDGIFRPGNLRKVDSRGVEVNAGIRHQIGTWQFKARAHTQFSATENAAVYDGSGYVLNKQLPYTPKFSAGAGLSAQKGCWSMAFLYQATGARFISSDNTQTVPGFHTGNFMISYQPAWIRMKACSNLKLDLILDNIWNEQYQSLINRPMPGFNWRLGLSSNW